MPEIFYSQTGGGQLVLETDSGRFYFDPKSGDPAVTLRNLTATIVAESKRGFKACVEEPKDHTSQKLMDQYLSSGGTITRPGRPTLFLEDLGL